MEKLNITQGECKVVHQSKHQLAITIGGTAICFLPRFQDNVLDNATLLSDAINTYNTTPILPSDLLKQRNDLLAALFELRNAVFSENDIRLLAASQSAKDLINKINATNA